MSKIYFSNNFSSLYVYKIDDIVYKKYPFTAAGKGRFINEVNFLHNFSKYPYFPKLLEANTKNLMIKMNYCGKNISRNNIPENWKDQIQDISNILKAYNIFLLDLQKKNILCKDNTIYIIDFDSYEFSKTLDNYNQLYNIFKNI